LSEPKYPIIPNSLADKYFEYMGWAISERTNCNIGPNK